jgi:hypothetical protein
MFVLLLQHHIKCPLSVTGSKIRENKNAISALPLGRYNLKNN